MLAALSVTAAVLLLVALTVPPLRRRRRRRELLAFALVTALGAAAAYWVSFGGSFFGLTQAITALFARGMVWLRTALSY